MTGGIALTIKGNDSSSGASFSDTASSPENLVTIERVTTKRGTGFERLTFNLHRDPLLRYDDIGLLQEVVAESADGNVLFEGAITGLTPEAGRGVKVVATGHFFAAKDHSHVSEIYIDSDTSRWHSMPINRRAALLAVGASPSDGSVADGGLLVGLAFPPWSTGGLPATGIYYTAPPGVGIGRLEANMVRTTSSWNTADANYNLYAILSTNDEFSGADITSDLAASVGTNYTLSLPSTTSGRRFAGIEAHYAAALANPDSLERAVRATGLKVYGGHGLSTITPSTVIRDLVDRFCPQLRHDADSIQDHPYEISQLVFEQQSVAEAIARLNAFANWDVAVWEGRRVHFAPAKNTSDPDYILSVENGDLRDDDGQSVSEDYPVNGVDVFYTDAQTARKSRVGPADDARLRSDDSENPCNKERRDRYGSLSVSFPCTQADAIQIGAVWLAEHLILTRTGSGSAIGTVTARNGQQVPVSHIRAGDVVRYADEDVGRIVYSTEYEPGTERNALKFDDATATLDAILERIGVAVSLAGGRG